MESFVPLQSSRTGISESESVFIDPDEETQQFIEKHQKLQQHMMKEVTELERNAVLEQENNVRHVIRQAEYFERKRITQRTQRRTPSRSSLTPRSRLSISPSLHKSSHSTESRTPRQYCMPLDVSEDGENVSLSSRLLETADISSTEKETTNAFTSFHDSVSSRFHAKRTPEGILPSSDPLPFALQFFTQMKALNATAPPPFLSTPRMRAQTSSNSLALSTSAIMGNGNTLQPPVENRTVDYPLDREREDVPDGHDLLSHFLSPVPLSPRDQSPLQRIKGRTNVERDGKNGNRNRKGSSPVEHKVVSLSPPSFFPSSLSATPFRPTSPSSAVPSCHASVHDEEGDTKEGTPRYRVDMNDDRERTVDATGTTGPTRSSPPPLSSPTPSSTSSQRRVLAEDVSPGNLLPSALEKTSFPLSSHRPSGSFRDPSNDPTHHDVLGGLSEGLGVSPASGVRQANVTGKISVTYYPPTASGTPLHDASYAVPFSTFSSGWCQNVPEEKNEEADTRACPEKNTAPHTDGADAFTPPSVLPIPESTFPEVEEHHGEQEDRWTPASHSGERSGTLGSASALPRRNERDTHRRDHGDSGEGIPPSQMLGLALRQPLLLLLSSCLWVAVLLPHALEMYGHVSPSPLHGGHNAALVLYRLEGLLLTATAMCLTFLVFWMQAVWRARHGERRGFFFSSRRVYTLFLGGGIVFAMGVLLVAKSFTDSTVLESTREEEWGGPSDGEVPASWSTKHDHRAPGVLWQPSFVWFRCGKVLQGVGAAALCGGWLALTAVEVGLTVAITLQAQLVLLWWPGMLWGVFALAPYWTSYFVSEVDVYWNGAFLVAALVVVVPLWIVALIPPSVYSQATERLDGVRPPLLSFLAPSHVGSIATGHSIASMTREKEGSTVRRGRRGEGSPADGDPSAIPSSARDGFLVDVPLEVDASVRGDVTPHGDAERPCVADSAVGTMQEGRTTKDERGSAIQVLSRLASRFVLRVCMMSTLLTAAILIVHTAPVTLAARSALSDPLTNDDGLLASNATPSTRMSFEWYTSGWFARFPLFFSYDGMRMDSPVAVLKTMAASAVIMWPMGFIPSLVRVVRHGCPIPASVLVLLMSWGLSFSFPWFPMRVTAIWSGITLEMLTSSVVRSLLSTGICWKTADGLASCASSSAMLPPRTRTANAEEGKRRENSSLSISPSPNTKTTPGNVEAWPKHGAEEMSEVTNLLTNPSSGPASGIEKTYGSRDGRTDGVAPFATCPPMGLTLWKENASPAYSVKEVEETGKPTGTAMREKEALAVRVWQRTDLEDVFVFSSVAKGGRRGEKRKVVPMHRFYGPWESFIITCACLMMLLLVLIFSTAVAWALLMDVEASSADHSPNFAGGVTEDYYRAIVNVIRGLGILVLMAQVFEMIAKRNEWNHLFAPLSP